MNIKDIRIVGRQLAADPGHFAVLILGLALAFAALMLLMSYLDTTLRADASVPEAERVLRLESMTHTPGADKGWILGTPMAFHDHWTDAGAPVAAASRYFTRDMSVRAGPRLFLFKIGFVDPGIVEVFGLHSVAGDLVDALKRPDAVVLGESTALKLFGPGNVIGKTVEVAGKTLTVRAVMPDRPSASALPTDILVAITSPVMPDPFRLTAWFSIRGTNFVRLVPGASSAQLVERAQTYFEQTPAIKELPPAFGKIATFRAVALPDIPLFGAESDTTRRLVTGLSISCLFITLLAAINYVNLSVVRTIGRQREIGIRKALGATPARIAGQFLQESVLASLLACALGLLLAWIAEPMVSGWVKQPLAAAMFAPTKLFVAVAFSVILGLIAGAYPAWVAMRIDCAQSLAGRGHSESPVGLWLRRGLTVLQFGAAMVLVSTTVVVLWQTQHASQADPGYDTAPLLAIDAPVDLTDPRLSALREAISHLSGVQAVGLAWDIPGRFNRNTTTELVTPKGQSLLQAFNFSGPGFFQSYGVRPVAGRLFDPELDKQGNKSIVVINARAVQEMGFASPEDAVGQKLRMDDQVVEIIGVVPNIRQRSLRDATGGVIYAIGSPRGVSVLSVYSSDPVKTRQEIEKLWPTHFPNEILQIETVQAQLDRLYEGDLRLGKMIGAGSLIALCLAAVGVYALSAYMVRRRTPEIVLRKLHGARRRHIARMLTREFLVLLAIGALIALPISAWLGEQYLSEYVDRAPIGGWGLAIALGCTALIVALAATRHTLRAMAISPLQALRA